LDRLQGQGIYVFCEKPIATTVADLDWLKTLPHSERGKIYCNQNYSHTEFCRNAKALIDSGEVGFPRHLQICTTHGLAFNPSFADNWRFKDPDPFSSIVGNLGIHNVHLAVHLFGDPDQLYCHKSSGNSNSANADTCSILMQFCGGKSVYIYMSYAAPYTNSAKLIFTDGILGLDDGCLRLYSPRDSFDEAGRYTTPPYQEICRFDTTQDYYDQSLVRSLEIFWDVVVSRQRFPDDGLAMALKSAKLVLDMSVESDEVGI